VLAVASWPSSFWLRRWVIHFSALALLEKALLRRAESRPRSRQRTSQTTLPSLRLVLTGFTAFPSS